jgi:hypothetical protein
VCRELSARRNTVHADWQIATRIAALVEVRSHKGIVAAERVQVGQVAWLIDDGVVERLAVLLDGARITTDRVGRASVIGGDIEIAL